MTSYDRPRRNNLLDVVDMLAVGVAVVAVEVVVTVEDIQRDKGLVAVVPVAEGCRRRI